MSGGWLVRPDELDSMDDASNGDAKKHVLGEGSSGFTTRQKWRGSIVAVKRVNVSTPTRVATFLREVDVLRRLRHPHVLPFYGAGLDPVDRRGGCFILTRVCEGGTMKQWLYPQSSNGGPGNAGARTMNSGPSGKEQPPLSRRLALAWDVACGMAYLESRGVMHRDLKPGNVFVTDSGFLGARGHRRFRPRSRSRSRGCAHWRDRDVSVHGAGGHSPREDVRFPRRRVEFRRDPGRARSRRASVSDGAL